MADIFLVETAPHSAGVSGCCAGRRRHPWSVRSNDYRHRITYLKNRAEQASELLPRVRRVFSLLTRRLSGTHQRAVRAEHLQDYLDEFAFRFNRGKSCSRGKLFYRLAQQAMTTEPTTYRQIVDTAQTQKGA
ncbi:MAG: transposase [Terracidiphilus sp.]